jgi:hypothetical protein
MRRSTLLAAFAAVLAAALWHLPATAQRAPATRQQAPPAAAQPKAGQPAGRAVITFAAYRDFRLRYIAQRQASLARQLAAPGLSAEQKARLAGIKSYYDGLAAMPAAERDRLFRARFDQIDADHDGTIDDAERAAWRVKRQRYYAEAAAERAAAGADRQ